jgi:hypothetical protein
VTAGTPPGSDAFDEASAHSETNASLVTTLASRPLGRQCEFLRLCSSLQARLNHFTESPEGCGSPPKSPPRNVRCFLQPLPWWSTLLPLP